MHIKSVKKYSNKYVRVKSDAILVKVVIKLQFGHTNGLHYIETDYKQIQMHI